MTNLKSEISDLKLPPSLCIRHKSSREPLAHEILKSGRIGFCNVIATADSFDEVPAIDRSSLVAYGRSLIFDFASVALSSNLAAVYRKEL